MEGGGEGEEKEERDAGRQGGKKADRAVKPWLLSLDFIRFSRNFSPSQISSWQYLQVTTTFLVGVSAVLWSEVLVFRMETPMSRKKGKWIMDPIKYLLLRTKYERTIPFYGYAAKPVAEVWILSLKPYMFQYWIWGSVGWRNALGRQLLELKMSHWI